MNKRRISIDFWVKFALLFALLASGVAEPVHAYSGRAAFSQIQLIPNIETIGVVLSGDNLPARASLFFRRAGESAWREAHPLVLMKDGRLAGSLFSLAPSTDYEVKVSDGVSEITGTARTQPETPAFAPSTILYVDDDAAPGGDGSVSAPFKTIQEAVNKAAPGTQILVADGIYHEAITFPTSGAPDRWIQIKAAGNGAILDGSRDIPANFWSQVEGKNNVWTAKIAPGTFRYLARDGRRMYMYDGYTQLLEKTGHGKTTIQEGWYVEPNKSNVYLRSFGDPSNYAWQFPELNQAFEANEKDWIWIEGFEIRYYGTADGCGICFTNSSHVVIRKNKIRNVQKGIYINWTGGAEQGNDTRIEFNEIFDPKDGDWPWVAVKATSMEGTAIVLRGRAGAILRGNEIHDYFNGIYTGSSGALTNTALAFDADIYRNRIYRIVDDALEPEGTVINQRFRENVIDSSFVGVSLAPVTSGPVWVLRNLITNYTGRGFKWDGNSDGFVFVYHNTAWTAQSANGMEFISPVYRTVFRNNIFASGAFPVSSAPKGSAMNDWDYNNWYSSSGSGYKWNNIIYASLSALCSAEKLECHGSGSAPGFSGGGNFSLAASSPNVDGGVFIPGINDGYSGKAPDRGVYEFMTVDPYPVVLSIQPNLDGIGSGKVIFQAVFSEPVHGVDVEDFSLAMNGVSNAAIAAVYRESDTVFNVEVNAGSGNGSMRLDLVDNDSIRDSLDQPLGGPGAGNGNFTGATATIERNFPVVQSINLLDAALTGADLVHFAIEFSESVNGVDAVDFRADVAGLSGVYITSVSGSGSQYVVEVFTGSGDGKLGLSVLDDDSITNAVGGRLGSSGPGNGTYTSSASYSVDKTPPLVASITRADPSPANTDLVGFKVSFNEPVAGVDLQDFALNAPGLNGASLATISGSGDQYYVIAVTGSGNGTLQLLLNDNDSIVDLLGHPLGGAGLANGSFFTGEFYSIQKTPIIRQTAVFTSDGWYDGWILETKEYGDAGGSKNSSATTLYVGDDGQNRQLRSIIQFSTASLPDQAVITQAILMLRGAGIEGQNPFTTHQNIAVDIRTGAFGSLGPFAIKALQVSDFQNPASKSSAALILNNPVTTWYWTSLEADAMNLINKTGVTQFRLRFQLDDDNDRKADYIKFYSGDYSAVSDRPQLKIEYYYLP